MQQNDLRIDFAAIWNGLAELAEAQQPLLDHFGHNTIHPDNLARYGNALMIEVAEFVNETGWKVWKPGFEPDCAKLKEEFADVLAFLGVWINLLKLHDLTPGDLAAAYVEKRDKNVRRALGVSGEAGYTGVKGSLSND